MNNSVNKWRERRVNRLGGTSVRTEDIAGARGDVWSRLQRRGGTATSGFDLVRGFYGRFGLCSDQTQKDLPRSNAPITAIVVPIPKCGDALVHNVLLISMLSA